MSKNLPVNIGLISAGSPKRLVGEDGENTPPYVTLRGRPIISYVVEEVLKSNLEHVYIWTQQDKIEQLREIVRGLPNSEKIRNIVPSKEDMFSSWMHTVQEYVTTDLFGGSGFNSWHELLDYIDQQRDTKETPVVHIPSDSPLIQAGEIDEFCARFDGETTDYCIGTTLQDTVRATLERHGLWDEFNLLSSTINNFTRISDDETGKPLSVRLNNLHILKPYRVESAQYDFFEEIFQQRKVSKISRWVQLYQLIRKIFKLPWLDDDEKKKLLYRTVWHLVLSQERLPGLIRIEDSPYTNVKNIEDNIGFLMSLRSRMYLPGRFGSYFDTDAQEEYDFLAKHFTALSADPEL